MIPTGSLIDVVQEEDIQEFSSLDYLEFRNESLNYFETC